MRALITGSNGHIGSNVVRACLDEGIEPVGLVRRGSDRRALAGLDVSLVEGDVLDPSSLARAMEGVELVFHVAGVHRNWAEDDATFLRPAVEGTHNVLEAARRGGVRRVVCTSSGATIGFTDDPTHPLDETTTNRSAKSVYTRSKIEAESVALAEAERGELDVVVVNPTGVLGPYDYRLTPATRIAVGLLQGDPCFFAVTLTDVRDVARGHVLAAKNGANGRRYLLAGQAVLPNDLADALEALVGHRPPTFRPPLFLLRWLAAAAVRTARKKGTDAALTPDIVADVYGRHLVYDSRRARDELGMTFRPTPDVLRDAVRWMLFVDALEPKIAARTRKALGSMTTPDAEWGTMSEASNGATLARAS